MRGTELRHLFRDLFATSFLCAPQLLLHRGDLEHSNLHRKALAQPSGQPMLITYACLPLPARFAMRVAGPLATLSETGRLLLAFLTKLRGSYAV